MKAELLVYADGRMDSKNASKYIGREEKTLAMWRSQGTGPKFVKRGRVYYFKDDLDAWLRNGRVSSTAQARDLKHAERAGAMDARIVSDSVDDSTTPITQMLD